jgi:hypothetical protein
MNSKLYKIKARTDREGNVKETPVEWLEQEYILYRVTIGQRGYLAWANSHNGLDTSAVQSVEEDLDGVVTIVTHNTIYILEPVKE